MKFNLAIWHGDSVRDREPDEWYEGVELQSDDRGVTALATVPVEDDEDEQEDVASLQKVIDAHFGEVGIRLRGLVYHKGGWRVDGWLATTMSREELREALG